jgi:integrase
MLTQRQIERAKPGRYHDGHGLYYVVKNANNKGWQFRFEIDGHEQWMGIGPLHTIGPKEARKRAEAARLLLLDGVNPIDHRRAEKAARKAAAAKALTFRAAAEQFHRLHEHEWSNHKHAAQVITTLRAYAFPVLGDMNVADVTTADVLKVVEPIWISKTETASRVRGRIEAVLGWAQVRGYRSGDNPARWRGHLDQALPKRSKVAPVEHHPALPYAQQPEFMAELRRREGVAAQALEFTVLACARTDETIKAIWDEIDFKEVLWRVPAGRMKGEKAHTVPLAPAAITLLKGLVREDGNPHIFIGAKRGQPLSNMAMTNVIRRINEDRSKQGLPRYVDPKEDNRDISVHGMRSTFRDWCAEQTNFPREVCEMALAHVIDSKAEAAYRRGDLLKKRRALAEAWARYCASPLLDLAPAKAGAVIPMIRTTAR